MHGTDAPDNDPNANAIRFLNRRLAELLADQVEMGHGELIMRVAVVDKKIKLAEFSPTEKHKF